MSELNRPFDDRVLFLLSHLDSIDGSIGLDESAFASVFQGFQKADAADAELLATQLLIVLRRCHREAGIEVSALVTAQVCVFLSLLLPNLEAVQTALKKHDIAISARVEAAMKWVGSAPSKNPVSGNVQSPSSLFNLVLSTVAKPPSSKG